MKLSEIGRTKDILIMGSSGTGKTHLIGTMLELLPKTLVVTADTKGLETLVSMGLNPEVIVISDWLEVWQYFTQIAAASKDYDCVAIDDFGAVQKAAEYKVSLGARGWADEKLVKDRGTAEFKRHAREELLLGERRLQRSQWGELFTALESFTAEVLKLPFKVKLFTTLEGVANNPRTGEEHIYPQLSGQVRTTFPARFSLVAETFVSTLGKDESKFYYCLSCRNHPRVETKSRFGEGRTWVNPTIAKVLTYINRKSEPESDTEKKIGTGL